MGFRFRKRIRLNKGLYINLGKKSGSVSIGGNGVTTNVSKRGIRNTFSLPGTGLSYQTKTRGCLWMVLAIPSFGAVALWLFH
jgi:hypothetical protein